MSATSFSWWYVVDLVPTLLDRCGIATPPAVQGRSLAALIDGEQTRHRERVIVEYSENEEAMIRDERFNLVYITGHRLRDDGYAPVNPLRQRVIELFDEESDPDELHNIATRPEHAERVERLLHQLADHLRQTARRPERLPPTDDVYVLIDACLAPDDVHRGSAYCLHLRATPLQPFGPMENDNDYAAADRPWPGCRRPAAER